MRIFEMLTRLLEVYPLFSDFFTVAQNLLIHPVIFALAGGAAPGVPTEVITMVDRKQAPGPMALYTIVDTIPGSDCASFGYKLGMLVKLAGGKAVPPETSASDLL